MGASRFYNAVLFFCCCCLFLFLLSKALFCFISFTIIVLFFVFVFGQFSFYSRIQTLAKSNTYKIIFYIVFLYFFSYFFCLLICVFFTFSFFFSSFFISYFQRHAATELEDERQNSTATPNGLYALVINEWIHLSGLGPRQRPNLVLVFFYFHCFLFLFFKKYIVDSNKKLYKAAGKERMHEVVLLEEIDQLVSTCAVSIVID